MKRLKCELCGGKWIVEDIDLENLMVCPYCAESIQTDVEFSEYDSLDKAIFGAVSKMGKDILMNPSKLSGFMLDTAPKLRKEIRVFSKTVDEDYVGYIISAFDQEMEKAEETINYLHRLFIEKEGLSNSWADTLCSGLYGAVLYTKGVGTTKTINVEIDDAIAVTSTSSSQKNPRQKKYRYSYDSSQHQSTLDLAERYLSANFIKEALEQYRQVACRGYVPAYNSIAEIYYQNKNYRKAWKWYLKSAESGDSIGQYYVGYFYQNGLHVQKNIDYALKYYEKAAAQGLECAIIAVADCYNNGIG